MQSFNPMDSTQYTLKEAKILEALPTFPNDRNALPKDVLLLAAYDFIDYFRKSVQAFEESHRDERYKPCMSQKLHADTIYKMIESRSSNPLYPDRNIVYQVYFIIACFMGVPDHRRSWWEENFAIGIGDYLDKTYHFQGCKSLIQALVRDLLKLSQYELDFDALDQDASTAAQTIQLREQLRYQPIVAITPRPSQSENKSHKDMNQQNNNSTVYNGPVTINQGPVYQGCTFNTTNNSYGAPPSSSSSSSAATNESQSSPVTDNPSPVNEASATQRRRGNTEKPLFADDNITEQEKQRLLSFLREHNLCNRELDAALDNSATQVIVCFYRVWQQKKLLAAKAGGTAVARFVNAVCELNLTVDEKAYANILNRMIKSSEKYPDWNGEVRSYFA